MAQATSRGTERWELGAWTSYRSSSGIAANASSIKATITGGSEAAASISAFSRIIAGSVQRHKNHKTCHKLARAG